MIQQFAQFAEQVRALQKTVARAMKTLVRIGAGLERIAATSRTPFWATLATSTRAQGGTIEQRLPHVRGPSFRQYAKRRGA